MDPGQDADSDVAPEATGWGALGRNHKLLLALLGATSFFDGFDRGILTVALPQIRDTYDLDQGQMSLWISLLYVGALPALLLTRRADKVGRRRLLLISIVGYTIATGLTAVAPSIEWFVAFQFIARLFLNAEHALVFTLAAEELPAKARGFGFGFLSMNLALGVGLSAIVFGTVFEPAGISWRAMYLVGLPPLVLIGWLRRRIPESRRFEAARDGGELTGSWRAILAPGHRRWLLLLCATAFLLELGTHASVFTQDFLQEDKGLSATLASLMLVAAGLPGIPIMVWAGGLSDRLGRRLVGCSLAAVGVVGALGFFWLPGGVPVLLAFMALTLVGQMGAGPVLGTYATELFPTALRGQAGSWAKVAAVGGQAGSLALGGVLISLTGGLPGAATVLMIGPIVAIAVFAVSFPDTHGRELEDTAGGYPDVDGVAAELATPI
ncbi:MAG TPA: MFS transporter [Acidimicrobiales bacterium]|nr:MFS transporter [Acidimicrobiales bacterium]